MKSELRIIIVLLALIVLYFYVPFIIMVIPVLIDNLIVVMAIISFAVICGLLMTRKVKEINNT